MESALSSEASSQALHFLKQTYQVKNPNWQEANQCAIYKRCGGVEPRTTWNKSSQWSERDLNSGSPDFKSGALTTGPRGLQQLQQPEIIGNGDNISFSPGGEINLCAYLFKIWNFHRSPQYSEENVEPIGKKEGSYFILWTVAEWELRFQDRRAAQSVPNLFYKLKKLQIKQIQDIASISLRKCKTKGKNYIASDFMTKD